MKLFQHRDFEQAVIRAADYFSKRGLRPAIIEKDYYVSEALRILPLTAPGKIIFKGGTSLAKGWNYFPPPDMTFSKSDALFPPPELTKIIGIEYEAQCKLLCYGPYPSWEEVQAKFREIRELL